jgi:hypothetical protein
LLTTLKGLGKRKPSKQTLQEQIAASLENSPMAESKTNLDQQVGE